MIRILDKHSCCGCNACKQKCPKKCISMIEDEEGFQYPKVDLNKCVDCHLCENVCPCLNKSEGQVPIVCYAAKNVDEGIRQASSSGGIFTAIAERTIADGGVVFGARFDGDWQVIHDIVESKEALSVFRGSKYVQSNIGETYKQAEKYLNTSRKVLFSGTPCQISGLKLYLRKNFDNLLTVEVACHGVPSPKIWREYLKSIELADIGAISHKDKMTGWRNYSFSVRDPKGELIYSEKASDDKYMMAFLRNLTIRPSCFHCPAKAGKSRADITLADYWGVENFAPQMDDNKGTSFICVNSEKGNSVIAQLNLLLVQTSYQESIQYNPCIVNSTSEPKDRKLFWKNYQESGIDTLLSLKRQNYNILKRLFRRLFRWK